MQLGKNTDLDNGVVDWFVSLLTHLVAEEEVELCQGGEVEVEAVGDEADVVLAAEHHPRTAGPTEADQPPGADTGLLTAHHSLHSVTFRG